MRTYQLQSPDSLDSENCSRQPLTGTYPTHWPKADDAETDGNPSFIREVPLHLDRGRNDLSPGWPDLESRDRGAGIPECVRQVIGRRLSRLFDRRSAPGDHEPARHLLEGGVIQFKLIGMTGWLHRGEGPALGTSRSRKRRINSKAYELRANNESRTSATRLTCSSATSTSRMSTSCLIRRRARPRHIERRFTLIEPPQADAPKAISIALGMP
jgi:hypothetical protein